MKKTLLAALAAVALAAAPALAAEVKLGVIDLQKALNDTKDGAAAKETLQQKYQPRVDALKAKEKELKDIAEKRKSSVLKPEAKAALEKEYEKKVDEYQQYGGRLKLEMDRENQAASQRIMDGLIDIAKKIGRDEGFSALLEKNASGLIFHQDALDLTERVVKAYNEKPAAGAEKKP